MTGQFLPDGVFRAPVVFGPEELDRFGRVDVSALLWQMQEIAGAHYTALGAGSAAAAAHNSFWALIRTDLEILSAIPAGKELRLDTWPGRRSHGLYRRQYRLLDENGGLLARSTSIWVLMDITKRALSADQSWIADPGTITQPEDFRGLQRRVMPELKECAARTVLPAETDINGHLNNTVYLHWAEDLLPEDFRRGHVLRALLVEYKKELPLGQAAELRYALEGDTLYLRGTAEGRDSFIMRCEYDPV